MFHLIKKDFLTFSKSKSDLLELLFMPFILISILGFALGNLMMNDFSFQTFHVGVVNEQDFEEDVSRLEDTLLEEGVPSEVAVGLLEAAQEMNPAILLEELLADESVEEYMAVDQFDSIESAERAMNDEEIEGFITIPNSFSYQVWQSVFLEAEPEAALNIMVNDNSSIAATILKSILTSFTNQYNLETSINLATGGQAEVGDVAAEYGEIKFISTEAPINAFQYYTIGMAVMFALSTGPAVASRAFKEKENYVFGRIMLSGKSPLTYLSSKMATGTILTFIQLVILFALSTVIFGTFKGKSIDFWQDMFYLTALYSLLVGSMASLLTSISLYANDTSTVSFFSSFNSVFAFLGGSFTPVEQFSESLKHVGNWTPNGATMTSYLQLMQGFQFEETLPLMIRVIGMTLIALVVSVLVFPKRRLS